MSTEKNNNLFREDEIVIMSHVDKRTGEVVTRPYPKVGGRLRLAHEENGSLSISTEIIRYEENVAVVRALATTKKGYFNGLGMASLERDQQIAPAILELAETRAIARSLRFAGYGVEYCSAEEVSHLENGNGNNPQSRAKRHNQRNNLTNGGNRNQNSNGRNNQSSEAQAGSNGNGRLSSKQYKYILRLADGLDMSKANLDRHCLEAYGSGVQYLSVPDASSLIDHLKSQ